MSLPDWIVDVDDVVDNPKLLVFGKPRCGKTVFSASDDNILILDCEPFGTISTKRVGRKDPRWKGNNIKRVKISKYADWEKAIEWLRGFADAGKPIPFKWIVIDTITALDQRIIMRYVLDKMLVKKPERNKYIPDKPEYLETQRTLVEQIKVLNDLPVNCLYLAHVMEIDVPGGDSFYYPKIQGKKWEVAQEVLSMTTAYGYMYTTTRKREGKPVKDPDTGKVIKDRIIMWDDNEKMQGGDRSDALGQFTKNKTLRECRELIEASNVALQQDSEG